MKKCCKNCGTLSEDTVKYCPVCGLSLNNAEYVVEDKKDDASEPSPVSPAGEAVSSQPIGMQREFRPIFGVREQLRAMAGSGRVIAVAVLLTVSLICSVLSTVLNEQFSLGQLNYFANLTPDFTAEDNLSLSAKASTVADTDGFGFDWEESDESADFTDDDMVFSAVSPDGENNETITVSSSVQYGSFLLPALTVLALWLIVGASKSWKEQPPTGGVSILRGISIIGIVGCALVLACLLLLTSGVLLASDSIMEAFSSYLPEIDSYASVFAVFGGILLGVLFAVVLLFLFYYIFLSSSFRAIKKTVQANAPTGKISGFSAVLMMIFGICGCFTVLSAIFMPLAAISSVCNAVALIIASTVLLKVRSVINKG